MAERTTDITIDEVADFDDIARYTMVVAETQALSLRSQTIDGPHIVLGLTDKSIGLEKMFRLLKISPAQLNERVADYLSMTQQAETTGEPALTGFAKSILKQAGQEARLMGKMDVEPHHILLAVLRQPYLATLMNAPENAYETVRSKVT